MYAAVLALAARLQQDAAGPTITADVTELDTHAQVRSLGLAPPGPTQGVYPSVQGNAS